MANTSAIRQQAAHTTHQLSFSSRPTKAIQKRPTLYEKISRIFSGEKKEEKKSREWTTSRKMTRQKEKEDPAKEREREREREDIKRKPNDSPEIPDRGCS